VNTLVKTVLIVAAQAALAYGLVVYAVGPAMRGEPLPWQKEAATEDLAEMRTLGPLLPMEEVLVNVAETKGRRFLKASMTLEIDGKELEKVAPERMPILRGKVIDLLSSKGMEELVQPSSRDTLRQEILDALNGEVSGGEFRDLYFTEFLVQ
jgi:flagellar FliL protein